MDTARCLQSIFCSYMMMRGDRCGVREREAVMSWLLTSLLLMCRQQAVRQSAGSAVGGEVVAMFLVAYCCLYQASLTHRHTDRKATI